MPKSVLSLALFGLLACDAGKTDTPPPAAAAEPSAAVETPPAAEKAPADPATSDKPAALVPDLVKPLEAPADAWVAFESQEGSFTTKFPTSPNKQVVPVQTEVGVVNSVMFASEAKDAYYAVGYSDFPSEHIKTAGLDQVLDGARNGAINNIGGQLIKEVQLKYAGQDARAFQASAMNQGVQMHVDVRLFIRDTRLYQVMLISASSSVSPNAQRFFDEFALTSAAATP